ncbi:MAG: hypothetical protein ABIL58_21830 [Pseudomonadota bacterium]
MIEIDDLHAHDDPPAAKRLPSPAASADSPLLDLNATILSLDWEITDTTLERLISEINRLKIIYQNDKLPFMFLQLLGSIGKYISVKKVKAHPDSIKMLHSVYAGFEQVLLNATISDLEKKKILSNEVRQFKSLKQRIRHTKPETDTVFRAPEVSRPIAPSGPSTKQPSSGSGPSAVSTDELVSMETMLTEIRKVIRDEFEALKTELRAMLGEE